MKSSNDGRYWKTARQAITERKRAKVNENSFLFKTSNSSIPNLKKRGGDSKNETLLKAAFFKASSNLKLNEYDDRRRLAGRGFKRVLGSLRVRFSSHIWSVPSRLGVLWEKERIRVNLELTLPMLMPLERRSQNLVHTCRKDRVTKKSFSFSLYSTTAIMVLTYP